MGTASIHEGVRRMRFSDLLDRTEAKELTQAAAAELLGINVRTFQRWAERYEAEGDDGLVDLRMGRRSPRRAPEEELERMLGLFRDKYADFTVKHFHEQLQKRHGYVLGYTVTKLALHAAGLVRKAPKRSAHRKKRPRRPLPGMLLHQDGSRHPWIEDLPAMDLIVTLDDATSEIYSMLPRRSLRHNKPKWDGLYRILGSSISRPIRRRRAGAPSGCSARCRAGCRRTCGSPGSRRSKPPMHG